MGEKGKDEGKEKFKDEVKDGKLSRMSSFKPVFWPWKRQNSDISDPEMWNSLHSKKTVALT